MAKNVEELCASDHCADRSDNPLVIPLEHRGGGSSNPLGSAASDDFMASSIDGLSLSNPTAANSTHGQTLSDPWELRKDPATGREYYFNERTNESVWERPTTYQDPLHSDATASTTAVEPASTSVSNPW